MKQLTSLSIAIAILVCIASNAICQDPCAKKEFVYRYWDDAKGAVDPKCAKNPLTDHQNIIKWPNGTNVTFCINGSFASEYGCSVSSQADLEACMRSNLAQLNSICPPGTISAQESTIGDCCVDIVRTTTQPDDIMTIDPTANIAKTHAVTRTFPFGIGDHHLLCDFTPPFGVKIKNQIYLNRTKEYLDVVQPSFPCPPPSNCSTNKIKVNLCTTILHEMGHAMGLGHTQHEGTNPCESSSSDVDDIMFPATGKCKQPVLSLNDKCMFSKLYCPGQFSGVFGDPESEKVDIGREMQVFPNPADQLLTVAFPSTKLQTTTIELYDLLGKSVLRHTFMHGDGNVTQVIELSKLTPGSYYIRIENETARATKLLQVK